MNSMNEKEILSMYEALFEADKRKDRFTNMDDFEFVDDYEDKKRAMKLFNLEDNV